MRKSVLFAIATLSLVAAAPAMAYDIIFNDLVTGDNPSGGPDFARLSIENADTNAVNFNLTHSGMADPGQFLSRLFVNLDNSYDNLSVASSDAQFSDWSYRNNGNNVAGGKFDMKFLFDTSNAGDRVLAGDTVSWTVMGDGLSADSFQAMSRGAAYNDMLHIQGVGPNNEGSAHVTSTEAVPEPGTMLILGTAAAGLLARRRRKI